MECPAADEIQDLLDRRLDAAQHDAIVLHADTCAACHDLIADLVRGAAGSGATGRDGGRRRIELLRGAALGPFIVLETLGTGAMGVVVAAYDPRLDRKVAVKVVRPDSGRAPALHARLLREAQAMAKLSHPNVITVYEVGTLEDDGGVFVAMEFIDGGTLTRWLSEAGRPWREIVALFERVGSGLAAAHAAGLVHRDFKPDNVLVGTRGQVRVTDFGLVGVAPVEPSVTPQSGLALTQTGTLLGTPLYMSPEQHRGLPVDARADQFAFCVSLYEALYRSRPFGGDGYDDLAANVIAGRVRESAPDVGVPARLRRVLLRGLAANPDARHPSMDALLTELERASRQVWRRVVVGLAATAVVVSVGLALWPTRSSEDHACAGAEHKLAGAWDPEVKARVHDAFTATSLPYGEAAWQGIAQRLDSYSSSWARMHTDACEATRRHGEQSEHLLDLRMACLDRRRSEIRALTALFARADAAVVEKSVGATDSLTDLADCADVERLTAPVPLPRDAATQLQVTTVRAQLAAADAYRRTGKYRLALALAEPALLTARLTGYQPALAEAQLSTGLLEGFLGQPAAAEARLFDAVVAASAGHSDTVEADARIALVAEAGVNLARPEEGLRSARLARAVLARGRDDPGRESRLLQAEGMTLDRKGAHDEARAKLEAALAIEEKLRQPDDLRVAICLMRLGNHDFRIDKYGEALAYYRRGYAGFMAALGPDHPMVATALNNIASTRTEQGAWTDVVADLEHALAIRERAFGPDNVSVAETLFNLGNVEEQLGHHERALASFRRAAAIADKNFPTLPNAGTFHAGVSASLRSLGRYDEALPEARRALAIREKVLGPDDAQVAEAIGNLASILFAEGHTAEALAEYQRCLAINEKALGPESLAAARALQDVGRALGHVGKLSDGMAALTRAGALLDKLPDRGESSMRLNHEYQGDILARAGKPAESLEAFRRALAIADGAQVPVDANAVDSLIGMARAELALGAPQLALAPAARAVAIVTAQPFDPSLVARARFVMARASWESHGDRPHAVRLAVQARDGLAAMGTAPVDERRAVEDWLGRHRP